uniref:Uncharacterized protein n=1 Tax=Rhizophora mucronata TaxID=61149 RepID=A0A2P2QC30_RHIMU
MLFSELLVVSGFCFLSLESISSKEVNKAGDDSMFLANSKEQERTCPSDIVLGNLWGELYLRSSRA